MGAVSRGLDRIDATFDDPNLVANAVDARERGTRVLTRTECVSAKRENGGWTALLSNGERLPALKRLTSVRVVAPKDDPGGLRDYV